MKITLFGLAALSLLALQPADTSDEAEREAVVAVLGEYHAAFEAGKPEEVAALLGSTFFIAEDKSSGGADRVGAHLFLAGEEVEQWPAAYLAEAGPYENVFNVLSVSLRGNAAVALTVDTGKNKVRSWQDEEIAWFFGRTEGQWRLVGFIVRDIQLPPHR